MSPGLVSEVRHPHRVLRSIGAVLAGALTGIVLSIGTDMLLYASGVFPPLGQPIADSLLLLATIYRTVYGIAGRYLTARLAADRPMMHSLILGGMGLIANIMGAVATWNKGPAFGHAWYPLALIALALPTAWAGARLRGSQ